jgi:hypothetical protein
MPQVKIKRKRVPKAVPALGAAGLTFSLVAGASASVAPINDVPQIPNYSPRHEITLSDEEIADVSLATFYVFDKENAAAAQGSFQLARGGGCGHGGGGCGHGGGGCGHGGGGRGCGGGHGCRGCGGGFGGCGGGGCGGGYGYGACCLSWGGCRPC